MELPSTSFFIEHFLPLKYDNISLFDLSWVTINGFEHTLLVEIFAHTLFILCIWVRHFCAYPFSRSGKKERFEIPPSLFCFEINWKSPQSNFLGLKSMGLPAKVTIK